MSLICHFVDEFCGYKMHTDLHNYNFINVVNNIKGYM
jgi:hypothetical protein